MRAESRGQSARGGSRVAGLLLACLLVATPLLADAPEADSGFPGWLGREDSIEEALREGEIVEKEPIGRGITNPFKVTLLYRGELLQAAWKPLSQDSERGPRESWAAEVVAYRLSRYLGIDRVPPTVPRRVEGARGSMQLWVEGVTPFVDLEAKPPAARWASEIARMRAFDVLIDNYDRNQGNFLVDGEGRLVWIDHSRALSFDPRGRRDMLKLRMPRQFDRETLGRMRELDLEALDELIGDLVPRMTMRSVLKQRDQLLERWQEGLRSWGEGVYLD